MTEPGLNPDSVMYLFNITVFAELRLTYHPLCIRPSVFALLSFERLR